MSTQEDFNKAFQACSEEEKEKMLKAGLAAAPKKYGDEPAPQKDKK